MGAGGVAPGRGGGHGRREGRGGRGGARRAAAGVLGLIWAAVAGGAVGVRWGPLGGSRAGVADSLPGWLGEWRGGGGRGGGGAGGPGGGGGWAGAVEVLSLRGPRAYVLRGLLTEAECDYLIRKAEPDLKRSFTVDFSTGKHKETKVRTSDDAVIARRADPTIAAIEEKIARVTMIPERHGEGLHILRYKESQKFMPHFDYFHDLNSSRAAFGGQRAATLLMYLATPEQGGETVFPKARVPPGLDSKGFSQCAQGQLAVRPKKGDALLFFSLLPDGTRDPTSMHGSCPVLKGVKYSATRWMRAHPHEGGPRRKSPGKAPVVQSPAHEARLPSDGTDGCVDTHEDCAFWQENGQCEANPAYMARHCGGSCQACMKKGGGG